MRSRSREHKNRFADFLWLTAILALALVPRLYLLVLTNFGIESDEAIVGLMGKHISEGRAWPVFYYGQRYLGTLEPFTVALLFKIFGRSNAVLKLAPLLYSLAFVILVYALSRRFTDRFGARIAASIAALGPNGFILWSTKARGGYIELLVIGTVALILATDLLRAKHPAAQRIFLLGLVIGLGWWTNNQILFYVISIGLVLAFHFLRSFGIRRSIGSAAVAAIGFFLGGAPFWYANVFERPRLESFRVLSKHASAQEIIAHLEGYFSEALPMIFGARRFWSAVDAFPSATLVFYLIYGFVVLLVFGLWLIAGSVVLRRIQNPGGVNERHGYSRSLLMLLLFFIVVPLVFSSSSFGDLTKEPRYLMSLYPVLFALVGIACGGLRYLFASAGTAVALMLAGAVIGADFGSNYWGDSPVPGEPFVYEGERVAHDQSKLYSWLTLNNYSHVWTNYWIGYRMAFETDERITFSLYRGPQSLRIPDYEVLSSYQQEFAAYVLVPLEAKVVARAFLERGLTFRTTKVGAYVVLDHVMPVSEPGERIEVPASAITVTSRPQWAQYLVDGDDGTRWGSGAPQAPDMSIEVKFASPQELAAIELDSGFWPQDAARELLIEADGPDGRRCTIFDSRGNDALQEVGSRWRIYVEPRTVSTIRLVDKGSDPVFDWSLAELSFFAPKMRSD